MKERVKNLISQLNKGKISICEIPEEYYSDFDIIMAERKLGIRKKYRCGYDVIADKFFVEEEIDTGEKGWKHLWPMLERRK